MLAPASHFADHHVDTVFTAMLLTMLLTMSPPWSLTVRDIRLVPSRPIRSQFPSTEPGAEARDALYAWAGPNVEGDRR